MLNRYSLFTKYYYLKFKKIAYYWTLRQRSGAWFGIQLGEGLTVTDMCSVW